MQRRPLCEGLRAFSLALPRFMPPSSPRLVGLLKWSKALAGWVFNEEKGKQRGGERGCIQDPLRCSRCTGQRTPSSSISARCPG